MKSQSHCCNLGLEGGGVGMVTNGLCIKPDICFSVVVVFLLFFFVFFFAVYVVMTYFQLVTVKPVLSDHIQQHIFGWLLIAA